MTLNEALNQLAALERELTAYGHAMGVLSYDGDTAAPRNSAAARGETMGVLSGVVHERLTAPGTREIIDTLQAHAAELDAPARRRAELLKEDSDELALIPVEEYTAYQRLLAESGAVWHEAKLRSDYASFAPYLEKIIDYKRRMAARKDASRPAYDVMLDIYEKGLTSARLDPFFSLLRQELAPVVRAVGEKPRPEDGFVTRFYPIDRQRVFIDRVLRIMGVNRDDLGIGETEHPFMDAFNKHDVRIATHYHADNILFNLFSVLHEGGHALYELGIADEMQGTLLAGGSANSIHESQSRLYENLLGRSRAFCEVILPVLKEFFPGQMAGVTPEKLYRAANLAEPTLVRTEADELTYSMHVMVRYELEKAMIAGDLKVADIPGEWNRMYREYLGIEVPDDRRGCLQDCHWGTGLVGYFPSYALGSAYGAQMFRRMEGEIDVWGAVRAGDFRPVNRWLDEKVHRFGRLLTPGELIENACGGPFDPRVYVDYLKKKYGELYGL